MPSWEGLQKRGKGPAASRFGRQAYREGGFSVFTAATRGTVRLTSMTTTSCRTSELKEMDRGVLEGQDGDRDTDETEQERSFSGCMNAEFWQMERFGENTCENLYTSGSGSSRSRGLKYPTKHAPGATLGLCLLGLYGSSATRAWHLFRY